MNYELENLIENGADANEIGEFLWEYHREKFNGRYFYVNNLRLYPVIEDGKIEGWEFD